MANEIFSAFQSRNFRLMWAGACTSSIGTWMQKVAQSWLVLHLSGSAFMLGLDAFLGEIPIFLLALVAGVFADRFERRRVLLVSQFVQMTCAFVLATLFATNTVQVWHILALSFVVGTAQAFGAPAYQSLLPSLVAKEHLSNAIAMNSIQFNLARAIGPALGGLAFTYLGAAWCFGLNGGSFVAVIISLLVISVPFIPSTKKETVMESMREGLRFIRGERTMLELIWVAFVCTFLGIPIIVFLPVFAKEVFHGTQTTFTVLLSTQSVGAIAGALLVAARGKRKGLGRDSVLALCVFGVAETGFALSSNLYVSLVFLFFGGLSLIVCFALLNSLVQMGVGDDMRGRVLSIYNIAFRGGMPIGSLVTGALVPHFGVQAVVTVYGVLVVVLALYLLVVDRRLATL